MGGEVSEEQIIAADPQFYLMTVADATGKIPAKAVLQYRSAIPVLRSGLYRHWKNWMARPKLQYLTAYQQKQVLALYQQYL